MYPLPAKKLATGLFTADYHRGWNGRAITPPIISRRRAMFNTFVDRVTQVARGWRADLEMQQRDSRFAYNDIRTSSISHRDDELCALNSTCYVHPRLSPTLHRMEHTAKGCPASLIEDNLNEDHPNLVHFIFFYNRQEQVVALNELGRQFDRLFFILF